MKPFAGRVAGLMLLMLSTAQAQDATQDVTKLAEQATTILKERCSRCHGGAAKQAGMDVLNRANLLQERGDIGSKFTFITPGDVEKSQLVSALEGDYMPQQGSPEAKAMTADERGVIRQWVLAGAPFPKRRDVQFISDKQVMAAIRESLLTARADDRVYLRYYTFAHLKNNELVSELDLRLYQAALAKVVNSLSLERTIYLPQVLPKTGESVFMIDMRKVGWNRHHLWEAILKQYPYGLKYDFVRDEELKQMGKDIALLSGTDMPLLRADWFVVTASQPPLYHELLGIPDHLSKLIAKDYLNVDLQGNFVSGDLQRSGFAKSGVSKQNRMIERHTSTSTPYFWISWDFLPRNRKGDILQFPLGPEFKTNPFNKHAFEQDGGEVIWSLPNGMQAYMLVKRDGGRIDSGPVDVVFDRSAILGTPSIINGISCMYCHREGMIKEFRDEIRDSETLRGEPREAVQRLFPPHDDMQRLVQQDQDLFMRSLERVIGPILKTGNDAKKSISEFPEPVGKVAEMYARDLTPREVALELGYEKVEVLQAKIEGNMALERFGMGTIVQNPPGTIKRDKWDAREGTSLMQDVARELRLGTPVIH